MDSIKAYTLNGNNHLHLFGVVGQDFTVEEVRASLYGLEDQTLALQIYLDSPGGFIDDGFALLDLFAQYQGKKVYRVGFQASSIASVLALSGDYLIMSPSAEMIVHSCNMNPASLGSSVNAQRMDEISNLMKATNERLGASYKMSIKRKVQDQSKQEELADTFKSFVNSGIDNSLTAMQLQEFGLCDEIVDNVDLYKLSNSGDKVKSLRNYYERIKDQITSNASGIFNVYSSFSDLKANGDDNAIKLLNSISYNLTSEDQGMPLENKAPEEEKELEQEQETEKEKAQSQEPAEEREEEKKEEEKAQAEEEKEEEKEDEDKKELEDLAAEIKRRDKIAALFKDHLHKDGMASLMAQCLENKTSVEDTYKKILAQFDKNNLSNSKVLKGVTVADQAQPVNLRDAAVVLLTEQLRNSGKFNSAFFAKVEQKINQRLPALQGENNAVKTRVHGIIANARNEFGDLNANQEFNSVVRTLSPNTYRNQKVGLLNLSTGDFKYLTVLFFHVLVDAYREYEFEHVLKLTKNVTVGDFNDIKILKNVTNVSEFREVAEGAETPFVTTEYEEINTYIRTFKQGFTLTFEALHKGNGAFNVYVDLLNAVTLNCLNSIRASLLRALVQRSKVKAVTIEVNEPIYVVDLLRKVQNTYAGFVDGNGTSYNVRPRYLVASEQLSSAFEVFFNSGNLPGFANGEYNPYKNYLDRVYDTGLEVINTQESLNAQDIYITPDSPITTYSLGGSPLTLNADVTETPEKNIEVRSRLDYVHFVDKPEHIVHIKLKSDKAANELLLIEKPVKVVNTTAEKVN